MERRRVAWLPNAYETKEQPYSVALVSSFRMPMAPFLRKTLLPTEPPPRWFWIGSLSLLVSGIALFALSLVVGDRQSRLFLAVIPLILICTLVLHAYYLLHAGRQRYVTEAWLRQSQELLREVTDHVQDVVWMLRTDTNELVYVSNAYEAVTGHSLREIRENPSSYKNLVHPEDRSRFMVKLEEARTTGKFDEEFRIVRADGVSRWIWSKGNRAGNAREVPPHLVGIAQDITERKQSEFEISKHLAAAEAARAEAEALRLSTLTLTKNLSMDTVLDTLMASLFEVVPYESASVILTEDDCLYVARTSAKTVQMLEGQRNTFLERVRLARKSVFVLDTAGEMGWEDAGVLEGVRSWICVPLVASTERPPSERVLGLLSVAHSRPCAFTTEHFRVAQSLAISAAVAIQNARLYERAEIYAAELEALIGKQGQWQARKAKGDA
jgi:PAS domain S-box-containing protein